jgi:hypothetical protein
LIAIGVIAVITGFMSGDATRTWSNILLNNYMILSIVLGGLFWMALQAITQSGWSAAFLRVPQAFTPILMFTFLLWIPLFFGLPHLFHWVEGMHHDPLIAHKSPYLNQTFLIVRTVVFFLVWFVVACRIRRLSVKEDEIGGLDSFYKIEFMSKVFIFTYGIFFFFFAIDWLMALDVHWFSTLYSVKMFVSAFYHGSAIITAIVIILYKMGYFPFMNSAHFHNFSKYIFMLSIMWGYMWFMQYFLIWYGNLPEETSYFYNRRVEGFYGFHLAEIFVNWAFPFVFLMWNRIAKKPNALLFTAAVLVVGQYIELYYVIMPDTVHHVVFGFVEIGTFIGYTGLFMLLTAMSLAKYPIIPKNHPYLEESIHLHEE